jgi:hypothetical protein
MPETSQNPPIRPIVIQYLRRSVHATDCFASGQTQQLKLPKIPAGVPMMHENRAASQSSDPPLKRNVALQRLARLLMSLDGDDS